jgi:phosphomannomutase
MRPSGTEPVVRIYAEAASVGAAEKLAEEARTWVEN